MTLVFLALFGLHFGNSSETDLQKLHTDALHAYQTKNFTSAKKAYEEILEQISPPTNDLQGVKCDWQTYIDTHLRLGEVRLALGELAEGKTTLQELLAKNPPPTFFPQIATLLARLLAAAGDAESAFTYLKEAEKILPLQHWRGEERLFFHSIEYLLNDKMDHFLVQAKAYQLAGGYLESAKIYEYVLSSIEKGTYPKAATQSLLEKKVRYRLAESHFLAANYDKTIATLATNTEPHSKVEARMLYLAAIAYKEKNEYEKAIEYFKSYIESGGEQDQTFLNEALYEIGFSLYQNNELSKAKEYFERIYAAGSHKKVHLLAAIYLARIYLKFENPEKGEEILEKTLAKIDSKNPLFFEITYLKAECAFALKRFEESAETFEKCYPLKHTKREWENALLFKLYLCHMHMGEMEGLKEEKRRFYFDKARSYLEKLKNQKGVRENIYLAEAELALIEKKFFQNEEAINQIDNLLEEEMDSFSNDEKVEAFLAIALMQPSLEKRAEIYLEAIAEKYAESPLYPEVFKQKGINDFQRACSCTEKERREELFNSSIASFEKAYSLFSKTQNERAAEVLKCEAKVNLYTHSLTQAALAIDKLLAEHSHNLQTTQEALLLKGLIALHLKQEERAEEALAQAKTLFQEGKYVDSVLYALATLYFQKGDYTKAILQYDELVARYPQSKYAGDALYWAAEASEHLRNPTNETIARRRHCYLTYSHCSHAPHAYFKCHTSEEYLKGHEGALNSLKEFEGRFQSSPLLVASNYFLGLHEKDFTKAIAHFEKAIQTFNAFHAVGEANVTPLIYYRYRSMLGLSSLYMGRDVPAEHLQAAYLIHSITEEFEDEKHPLSSACNHPELYEESQFLLGCCYLKLGKDDKGREIFFKMLSQYDKAGVKKAYYLSRIWQKQGEMALLAHDTDTAIKCFEMADECGEGHLLTDERLNLWLQISEVWKEARKYDLAMRMLSKIINEDVVSDLRLQAMYARSEIYELEGRRELAIRQLESIAKKEGSWALQAKDKLKKQYGVE